MLENRSFDSMFGKLYPKSVGFEELSGDETNDYHSLHGIVQPIRVWNNEGMDAATATIPDPEPTNDGPQSIAATVKVASAAEVQKLECARPNQMQQSLRHLAARLPATQEEAGVRRKASAKDTSSATTPAMRDVKSAAAYAMDKTRSFLKSQQ